MSAKGYSGLENSHFCILDRKIQISLVSWIASSIMQCQHAEKKGFLVSRILLQHSLILIGSEFDYSSDQKAKLNQHSK